MILLCVLIVKGIIDFLSNILNITHSYHFQVISFKSLITFCLHRMEILQVDIPIPLRPLHPILLPRLIIPWVRLQSIISKFCSRFKYLWWHPCSTFQSFVLEFQYYPKVRSFPLLSQREAMAEQGGALPPLPLMVENFIYTCKNWLGPPKHWWVFISHKLVIHINETSGRGGMFHAVGSLFLTNSFWSTSNLWSQQLDLIIPIFQAPACFKISGTLWELLLPMKVTWKSLLVTECHFFTKIFWHSTLSFF